MVSLIGLLEVFLAFCIIASVVIYVLFKYSYTYWRRRGVKGPKPTFPEGNFQGVFTKSKHMSAPVEKLYKTNKSDPYVGVYSLFTPVLVVNDLDLIKSILIKDFDSFDSHGILENEKIDPLSINLFSLSGERWKDMRSKLSPVFTSGKMKIMMEVMIEVQKRLSKHIKQETSKGSTINFKDILGYYTMDIIGSCGFGIECDTFENPNSEFVKYAKEGITPKGLREQITFMLGFMAPRLLEIIRVSSWSSQVIDFFTDMVSATVRFREQNNIKRNDLLQLLIQLKNNELKNDNGEIVKQTGKAFSSSDLVAQVFVFLIAGYETSSSAAGYALYWLARCPRVQDRARQEIRAVMSEHGHTWTYDALHKLEYLTMVIEETLRMHPALNFLFRKSTKPYNLPNSSLVLEKNTQVYIPVIGIHMDPDIYPEPHIFKPERFTKEEKAKRHKAAYLPFGDGPRICIGMRFAMMQVRLALVAVLADYQVSVCEKTKIPLELDVSALVSTPKDGIFLKVEKIQ